MRRKYDSYEIEIILSLGFLLLFLVSLNFISGYSFQKARLLQRDLFERNLGLSADYSSTYLETRLEKTGYSSSISEGHLSALAIRIGAENITLYDTLGNVIAAISPPAGEKKKGIQVTVERILYLADGRPLGRLKLESINTVGMRLDGLSQWDTVFRILGLIASLMISALFLKAVLLPYRRIKREALDFNLDISEPGQKPGIEYIVNTFKNLALELEEKRRQLESSYKKSEQRADSLARHSDHILGTITSGVIICDSNGIITRFNPSAQQILQYLEGDVRGKHYREIFGREHKLVSLFDDALNAKKVYSRLEFDIRKPDGARLSLGCSTSLINDEKGGGSGAAILFVDLTEIRCLQEQTAYSEKMAALGETAAGLAHEIRNSFAAIIGFADLLKKMGGPDEGRDKLASAIKEESNLAENLMSRFLNFARPLNLNLEQIDIAEIIKSATANANSGHISIITEVPHDIPRIPGDSALLRQAISNLVINACDAVGESGEVKIRAGIEKSERGLSHVIIDVMDNGMGIDPEIGSRIFEPFVSGKARGTGLGLALAKKIIVLHGGRIEAHSKPGKGARFTISLPISHRDTLALARRD